MSITEAADLLDAYARQVKAVQFAEQLGKVSRADRQKLIDLRNQVIMAMIASKNNC